MHSSEPNMEPMTLGGDVSPTPVPSTEREELLLEIDRKLRRARENGLRVDDFLAQLELAGVSREEHARLIHRMMLAVPRGAETINPSAPAGAFVCEDHSPSASPIFRVVEQGHTQVCKGPGPVESNRPAVPPDVHIPGYEVMDVIARGGMGVVYKARQLGLNRIVALKMVLAGKYASSQDLERFWREAEAVASLSHPNIVQVYEIGRHDGYPFFSLEHVDGGTLAEFLKTGPLPHRGAAVLAEQLAKAMRVAHENQIIHRDLKPANILLAGRPDSCDPPAENSRTTQFAAALSRPSRTDSNWVPKITDFGVAKRLNETGGLTATGIVAGTPQYMAPEQALADPKNPPSAASDIYSIGVILYECLTGRVPIDGDNGADVMRRVIREVPAPPGRHRPGIPRDLETICLKCLEKQPRLRYQSASELGSDLRRWLDGRPIKARPVGRPEQAYRWARRNPLVAGLLAGIMGLLVVGAATATGLMLRANQFARIARLESDALAIQKISAEELARRALDQEQRAINSEKNTKDALGDADRQLRETQAARRFGEAVNARLQAQIHATKSQMAYGEHKAGHVADTSALLEQMIPKSSGDIDQRGFEWYYLKQLSDPAVSRQIYQGEVAHLSPTGKPDTFHIGLSGCLYRTSLDPADNDYWPITPEKFDKLAIHRESGQLAFAPRGEEHLVVLDLATRTPLIRIPFPCQRREAFPRRLTALRFSPDGCRLMAAIVPAGRSVDTGHLAVWDVASGREVARFHPESQWLSDAHYSADGRRIVFSDYNGNWWVRDSATFEAIASGRVEDAAMCVMPNRDASLIVLGGGNGRATIVEPAGGKILRHLFGHAGRVGPMTLAPDGKTLATSAADQSIRLWNIETGENTRILPGHFSATSALAFSDTGDRLISGSVFGEVHIWDCRRDPGALVSPEPNHQASDVFHLPDGRWIVADERGGFRFVGTDADPGTQHELPGASAGLARRWALSADGKTLALGTGDSGRPEDRGVWLFQVERPGDPPRRLGDIPAKLRDMAFAPDGAMLATIHDDGQVRLIDPATGKETGGFKSAGNDRHFVLFVNDGRELITVAGGEAAVRRWTRDGRLVWERKLPPAQADRNHEPIVAVAVSPNGQSVAVAIGQDGIMLLETERGEWVSAGVPGARHADRLMITGHSAPVERLAFDPTGARLASTSRDSTVRVWDARHGHALLTLRGHSGPTRGVAFSADGSGLATVSASEARIWDGRFARWRDDLRQISKNCRMHCVRPTVAGDGTVTLDALFVNESDRGFRAPDWSKVDDRLRAVVLLEGPKPGAALPDTLFEMNRRRIGHTPFILFDEILGGEALSVRMSFKTQGWPAGKYRLWFTHSCGREYSGNEAEMTEFEIPPKVEAPGSSR